MAAKRAKSTHGSLMSTGGASFSSSASESTQQDQAAWSYKGMSKEKVVGQIDFIDKVLRDTVAKIAELDSDKITVLKNGEPPAIYMPLIAEIDEQLKSKKKFQKKHEAELRVLQEAIERSTTATTTATTPTEVPYILSTVITNKIPCLYNDVGTIGVDEYEKFFLDKIIEFMERTANLDAYESAKDVHRFLENFYDFEDFSIDAEPWSARIFINNEWTSIMPSDEDIYAAILISRRKHDQNNLKRKRNSKRN